MCGAGHSHGLHNHVGAEWSGVFYVSVPSPSTQDDSYSEEFQNFITPEASNASADSDGSDLSGHLILRLCSGGKGLHSSTSPLNLSRF